MKRWNVIHKMKVLYDEGKGLSIRQISKELDMARNTVKKYLRLPTTEISKLQDNRDRKKCLDNWNNYIVHLLQNYPNLSAHKIFTRLRNSLMGFSISERTVRRYVGNIKQKITTKKKRYYEPIIDMVPGVQCQVDGGELSNVIIAGILKKIYFLVFVLSYSRLMYVSLSDKPINTPVFIRMHDEAFRYFGGISQECVYDQTKLVVIKELFREVDYNQRFHQYAATANFQIRVCKGYDPESKGKVESGVKYVKNNFFYGEEFTSLNDLQHRLSDWIVNVSNTRIHGTTNRVPIQMYEAEEKQHMQKQIPKPTNQQIGDLRKADKTSLISYKSNKYSVPMLYQSSNLFITVNNDKLFIGDIGTGEIVADHNICYGKSKIIKNANHYRDYSQEIEIIENEIEFMFADELGKSLCMLIKKSSPKIYRDQLVGVKKVLSKTKIAQNKKLLSVLVQKPRLTACMLKEHLEAHDLRVAKDSRREVANIKTMPILRQYAIGGLYANI